MIRERFEWSVRVYYEDTDAAGIVYHANYLRFMERARTEWLRSLGFEQNLLVENRGVLFVVNRTDVKYFRGARLNEDLKIVTQLVRLRGASMMFEQLIEDRTEKPVCSGGVSVACVHSRLFKPCRIPVDMRRVFEGGG